MTNPGTLLAVNVRNWRSETDRPAYRSIRSFFRQAEKTGGLYHRTFRISSFSALRHTPKPPSLVKLRKPPASFILGRLIPFVVTTFPR